MADIDLAKLWASGAPPAAMPADALIDEHGSLVAFQIHAAKDHTVPANRHGILVL